MKHGITAALYLVICAQSLPALAEVADATIAKKDAQTTESIGVVSGLAIGAVLGGPPGAIVAAAAGGWLGDQWVTRKNYRAMQAQLEKTEQQLANSQSINGALQQRQLVLTQQLTDSRLLASTEKTANPVTNCCSDSEVILHFRSDSHAIEPHYRDALLRFVTYSKTHPDRNIEVTGFADRRGESSENLFLSQRRVEAVVKVLQDMGLSQQTFKTVAYGERDPISTTEGIEGNFFERRVVLRLSGENQPLLSSAGQ